MLLANHRLSHHNSCMDGTRSQHYTSSTSERWIPPSAISRNNYSESSDDVKFRKIRGILNKLTPQTFDRLTEELVHVGLDSPVLLSGLILLIIEKAVHETKYVSMYAQLCQQLSSKVPNFDSPNPDNTTTFRRLLLNKCQIEYANRAQASASYDHPPRQLTPDEEEERLLAKRKMLGNIKFIGELGKLEMVTHSILHKCCEELLKKTKEEDLECLCQIMSTCGHLLDNEKGRYRMDQYFDHILELSENETLPARIRFLLQDVIELRENQWMERKIIFSKELPKPIEEIRRDAHDELGLPDDPGMGQPPVDGFRHLHIDPQQPRPRQFGSKKRTGLEDVFGPIPLGISTLGTGPGVISPRDSRVRPSGMNPTGFRNNQPFSRPPRPHQMNNYGPVGGMRGYYSGAPPPNYSAPNFRPYYQSHHNYNHRHPYNNYNAHQDEQTNNDRNQVDSSQNGTYDKAPIAPRFQKNKPNTSFDNRPTHPLAGVHRPVPMPGMPLPLSNEEFFRTQHHPIAPHPITQPTSLPGRNSPNRVTRSPVFIQNESARVASPLQQPGNSSSLERKENMTPTLDDINKNIEQVVDDLLSNRSQDEACEAFKRLKIPVQRGSDAIVAILKRAVNLKGLDREAVFTFIVHLIEQQLFSGDQLHEAFQVMLDLMKDLEVDIPRIKSYVAAFGALAIRKGLMSIAEVAGLTQDGKHYPFLLLVLQYMERDMEKNELAKLFGESKVDLLTTLPKGDCTKDRIAEILEERELSFLCPLLQIQTEMTKQISANPNPSDFLQWIQKRVVESYQTSQGFIYALMFVIFKYIRDEALLTLGGSGNESNEKQIKAKEQELLIKYKPVLSTFLEDNVDLQVYAIYAMQSAWFEADCPKVMLLRWFMNTYELDIIEDEAFFKWKEDVTDAYPGKGKALFQVINWLNCLEEEEEDE